MLICCVFFIIDDELRTIEVAEEAVWTFSSVELYNFQVGTFHLIFILLYFIKE